MTPWNISSLMDYTSIAYMGSVLLWYFAIALGYIFTALPLWLIVMGFAKFFVGIFKNMTHKAMYG